MGECGAPGDVNSNVLIARSTGDAQLDKAVWQWLSWDKVGVWRRAAAAGTHTHPSGGPSPPSRGRFVIGPVVFRLLPILPAVEGGVWSLFPQQGPFLR